MAARPVSELAKWDGRLDKQRQNSKWRRSSSRLARDPYHTPLENQSFGKLQPSSKSSDMRRAEQSTFRPNLERDSLANSTAYARLRSRADTRSPFSHNMHHHRRASVTHTTPSPALPPSPFITSSTSSHITPNSSVYTSRVHNSRHHSSRERIALLQPASKIDSDVIDLTLEDTEDELSVTDMLVPNRTNYHNQYADPGPSRQPLSSASSSPIAPEQSLFTPPPPPKRRTRLFVAVPSFPKGLTKADYQPLSRPLVVPSSGTTVINTLGDSSPAEPSFTEEHTPSQKRKGKEREHGAVSSRQGYKQRPSANGAAVDSSAFLDAFYGHIMIPLLDDDTYPPLTTLDLVTNTRFYFAGAWRAHASRLREAELDWISEYSLRGKACIRAQSGNSPSPPTSGAAGFVSSVQLRPWELVLPESSAQDNSTEYTLDGPAPTTGSDSATGGDVDYLLLPDDALPGPSATSNLAPSNSTVSQGLTIVEAEHDMDQYFNGLGDSPVAHVLPRQQPAPTHTFRPNLLQSAGNSQTNSLALGFPSLELDPRLADTGDHECFLGVPPSPPPVNTESSAAPGPMAEPPFEPVNYFPASPNNIFEASPAGAWSFEQGEGLPDNDLPSDNHVAPSISSTIDPSLLGPEQSETQLPAPKATTPRRRSKLPDPVIYIRRPIDSSSLPLLSGKRPVQIKYRDPGGSPTTPSTQTGTNEAPSNLDGNSIEQTGNETDEPPHTKRRSVPSRKLRESYDASDSGSDYIPETSTSNIKLKLKRPSLRDKESIVEHQAEGDETAPTMSYCHQCRNKSARPKMFCSNVLQGRVCGKRFCNRCILYRYPDVTFDEHSAGFLCPVCTNTCNCSFCSRNRGEEFISMRLGGLAASFFKAKVTLVRDVGKPPPHQKSPPANVDARRSASATTTPTPEPSALPSHPKFWAHVYGMEGERVGSAFMTPEHMERLRAGEPSKLSSLSQPQPHSSKKARKPSKRDKTRDKPRGPRVFVGRPLASWKIGAVRDVEPSVDVETNWDEGKAEDQQGQVNARRHRRRRRCYIGNPAPLYEPYQRIPSTASPTSPPSSRCSTPAAALDSDGSMSPLSGLEADDWPQPEVGECCTWEPPAPPGTIVPGGLSRPFVPGLGSPPGAVGVWPDVDGPQGAGSSLTMEVDGAEAQASGSAALSDEAVKRAISAALAALSLTPPS